MTAELTEADRAAARHGFRWRVECWDMVADWGGAFGYSRALTHHDALKEFRDYRPHRATPLD